MQPKPPLGRGPLAGPSYQPPSAPPLSPKGSGPMPAPSGRTGGGMPHGSEQRLQSSNQYLRTPVVRYSSRMRVGKLHPLRVTLTGSNNEALAMKPETQSGGFDPPIVVQLSVPGALVTPPHVIIPISGGEAQFVVQPLISGKLTNARLEFLAQGRRVSEMPLPMKANRGYWAKGLLLLGLLLPFIIHYFPSLSYTSRLQNTNAPSGTGRNEVERTQLGRTENVKSRFLSNGKTGPTKNTTPSKADEKATSKSEQEETKPTNVEKNKGSNTDQPKDKTPAPDKKSTTPEKKLPALSRSELTSNYLALITVLTMPQEPRANALVPEESSKDAQAGKQVEGTPYKGEDAIWAWVRGSLDRAGYATKLTPSTPYSLFNIDRKYEVTKDTNHEWSSEVLYANVLYYCEPVLRLLYKLCIVFPLSLPFGDIIYSLLVLTLAALVWMYTNPNHKKLKGPLMDIRLAHT